MIPLSLDLEKHTTYTLVTHTHTHLYNFHKLCTHVYVDVLAVCVFHNDVAGW